MAFEGFSRATGSGGRSSRPAWVIPLAIVIVGLGVASATLIATSANGGKTKTMIIERPPARSDTPIPPSSVGSDPTTTPGSAPQRGVLGVGASQSFESLAASIPARIGLAVAPFSSDSLQEFGDLRTGHAWSTIKVPILVTLMRERGPEGLGSEEEAWAVSALTASDNEAAAGLFGEIESTRGDLEGASLAVGETLTLAGDTTTAIATAPPPPGAVSTYGQTSWSLGSAAQFQRALGEGCLLDPAATSYVIKLMEGVIPEQRWGLGEASFSGEWSAAMKGGWGPEGDASGPYLVRQSGILRQGDGGIAVAMMAIDDSGSYEAGAADLTQIAQWLADRLGASAPASRTCA